MLPGGGAEVDSKVFLGLASMDVTGEPAESSSSGAVVGEARSEAAR